MKYDFRIEKAGNRRTGIGATRLLDRVDRQLAGEPTTGLVTAPEGRYPAWLVAVVAGTAVTVLIGAVALLVWDGDRLAVGAATTIAPRSVSPSHEWAVTSSPYCWRTSGLCTTPPRSSKKAFLSYD